MLFCGAGLGPLIVGSIPKQGVRWFAYDMASSRLKVKNDKGVMELTSGGRAMAGFLAGTGEVRPQHHPISPNLTRFRC